MEYQWNDDWQAKTKLQNYKVYFGLYPSSGIYDKKSQRFGDWICLRPQVDGQDRPIQLGPLERASLNH
jgi:hypothetical protein